MPEMIFSDFKADSGKLLSVSEVKLLMSGLLGRELARCRCSVASDFIMEPGRHLFVLRCHKNKMRLRINLTAVFSLLKSGCLDHPCSLLFCVYYIGEYVRRLENAAGHSPSGYYEGLAGIDAIHTMVCERKKRIFSPFLCDRCHCRAFHMSPLEALCDVNALLRLNAECSDRLNERQKAALGSQIREEMLYLDLPEAVFDRKGISGLTIRALAVEIKEISERQTGKETEYVMLRGLDWRDDDAFLRWLAELCKTGNTAFWSGVFLRMAVCSPRVLREMEKDEVLHAVFSEGAREFQENAVRYHERQKDMPSEKLRENFGLIRDLTRRLQILSLQMDGLAQAGTIHGND